MDDVEDEDEDESEDESSDADVAVRDEESDVEIDEVPAQKVTETNDWNVAFGPYLWASSVDANVSLGGSSVSTGIDFFDIKRHAKYGIELLGEAHHGRLAIYGDLLYGVVGVGAKREVGPIMVELEGEASSLLVDAAVGVRVAGTDTSLFSVEALAGVRYQRTAITGSINVAGTTVMPTVYVDASTDALAGAHVLVRPHRRFSVAGTVDYGVYGDSDRTWSATADATIRITKRVRASLGWRTLTTERTNVSIVMHGPRAALQLTF